LLYFYVYGIKSGEKGIQLAN